MEFDSEPEEFPLELLPKQSHNFHSVENFSQMDSSIFEDNQGLGLDQLFQKKETLENFTKVEILKFESRLKQHLNQFL